MGAVNDQRRAEIVKLLSDAVDSLLDAVGSGRLGFDYAVKEYVEASDDELSHAFRQYVQALDLGDETERIESDAESERSKEVRREVLLNMANQFNVPEVTAFVAALLESQDKELSLVKTLEGQAEQLHKALSSA